MIQSEELFKKKDNSLNRVINYNLIRVLDLMNSIEKMKKMVFYYQDNLTFSIARCYYLCFQAREEITRNSKDLKKLAEIKSFLCDRPEKVFTKLYNRKISKALLKLDSIEKKFLVASYEDEAVVEETLHYFS